MLLKATFNVGGFMKVKKKCCKKYKKEKACKKCPLNCKGKK